jgi:tetraacyldisaccharide 4'-kinase
MFKTPAFWYSSSFLSTALTKFFSPLGWLYYYISTLYQSTRNSYKLKVPVICIGNFTVGGSGKTPSVVALADLLKARGENPHIITRGYGTINNAPVKVDLLFHTFEDVGDEALILAKAAPTWVCIDRVKAAKEAEKNGATLILMDDGFQNNSIHKTLSLIVVDSLQLFGNEMLFPLGPLRTPLSRGGKKADAFFYLNAQANDTIDSRIQSFGKPIFTGKFISKSNSSFPKDIIAFAGIGYPYKFYQSLIQQGYSITQYYSFPDHHPYSKSDLEKIISENPKAFYLTTEKDWLRIPAEYQQRVHYFPIELVFDEPIQLTEFLLSKH